MGGGAAKARIEDLLLSWRACQFSLFYDKSEPSFEPLPPKNYQNDIMNKITAEQN